MHTQAFTQTTDPVIPWDPFRPKWLSGLISSSSLWVALTVKVDNMSHSYFNKVNLQSEKNPCYNRSSLNGLQRGFFFSVTATEGLQLKQEWSRRRHFWVNNLHKLTGMLIKVCSYYSHFCSSCSLVTGKPERLPGESWHKGNTMAPLGNQREIHAPTRPLWHCIIRKDRGIWAVVDTSDQVI